MAILKQGSVKNKGVGSAGDDKSSEVGGWQKQGRKRKTAQKPSPIKLLDSDPPSPCVVCKKLVEDDGIQCDRCQAWAHGKTQGSCCGLAPSVLKFLTCNPIAALKWFCPICEKESLSESPHDKIAQQSARIDTLTQSVLALQQQNNEILSVLQQMQKDRTLEDKVKVQVSETLEDIREKDDRANNLVFFNVHESKECNREGEKKHDKVQIKSIVASIQPNLSLEQIEDKDIIRLGKKNGQEGSKPRPVKVILKSVEHKNDILKNAWRLKDHEQYRKIGISADKTKKERQEEKSLREEYNRRKGLGEEVVILKGRVLTKQERLTEQNKYNGQNDEQKVETRQTNADSKKRETKEQSEYAEGGQTVSDTDSAEHTQRKEELNKSNEDRSTGENGH